jgi:DNA-binding CsgD family transcriptional regulator
MHWGSHRCVFYETKQELLDLVVPYLRAGVEANEFCFWAKPDCVTAREARTVLDRISSKHDRVVLQILSAREFYGTGDFGRIARFWEKLLNGALAKGFEGMRICGDMFWLDARDWNQFCIYEMGVNVGITSRKSKGLCTYPLTAAGVGDIVDVAVTHQCTIAKRKREWAIIDPSTLSAADVSESVKRLASLSQRERQVLDGVLAGRDKARLAFDLGISVRTIETHRSRMLDRLNVATLAEAARIGALAKSAA